jgi:hypothetical protein
MTSEKLILSVYKGLRDSLPQRKKGFSALCVFDIGGDEKIRTSDPGFAQMLP